MPSSLPCTGANAVVLEVLLETFNEETGGGRPYCARMQSNVANRSQPPETHGGGGVVDVAFLGRRCSSVLSVSLRPTATALTRSSNPYDASFVPGVM